MRLLRLLAMGMLVLGTPAWAADFTAFIGKWDGEWKGGLKYTIAISSIDADGTMHGTATWGDKKEWGVKAGSFSFNQTKISADGKFSFADPPNARHDWSFANGKLNGLRFQNGTDKPVNTATLSRVK